MTIVPSDAARVSVIIPTHNRSALLMEAVDSVLAQTFPVHEIVVIDDGSAEPHRTALETLTRRSSLIRAHLLPPGERSRARNEGLANATGDFVLFMDDDDRLDEGMIASAMQSFADDPEVDVVVGLGSWFGGAVPRHVIPVGPFWTDSSGTPNGRLRAWMGLSDRSGEWLERKPAAVLLRCAVPINAFVIRRDAIGATRFPEDVNHGEDWIFRLDLAAKGCRFKWNPNAVAFVRWPSGDSGDARSRVVAFERVYQRFSPLGREEAFFAAAHLVRSRWRERRVDWWRLAILSGHPTLLFKYGRQFLARKIFRLWLRVGRTRD